MEINLKTNWKYFFNKIQIKNIVDHILNQVRKLYEHKIIFPKKEEIFRCFNYFNIEDTKVVIIGQDPYYKMNQANGLAFSVNEECPLPKSLKNIFTELKNDLNIVRTNGNLSSWAQQGVLLLNSILTVEYNHPGSHYYLQWEKITDEVIKELQKYKNIVYILWGNWAKSKIKLINQNNNLVIFSSHPSPLSAHCGFFGSKPFSKTNNYLKSKNIKVISW